ncbi:hypothetical protein Cfor_08943, partial [Coptotermes formosanus]
FSSGDLSSELDNAPDDVSTTSSQQDAQPVSNLQQGQAYQPTPAHPAHPTQSQSGGDLSLNLRPGSRTTSAPSSPAKTRESLLQRVQSLTGVARDQGASILGKYIYSLEQVHSFRKYSKVFSRQVLFQWLREYEDTHGNC